jgi:hypothetical protein
MKTNLLNTALKNQWFYISVGAILILGILLTYFTSRAKNKPTGPDDHFDHDDLSIDTQQLTLDQNQLNLLVESLLTSMSGYFSDDDEIVRIMDQISNKDELLYVIQKFGIKPYNGSGLATTWVDINMFSTDLNLAGWLKEELSGDNLDHVQAMFENYQIPF